MESVIGMACVFGLGAYYGHWWATRKQTSAIHKLGFAVGEMVNGVVTSAKFAGTSVTVSRHVTATFQGHDIVLEVRREAA